MQMMTPGAGPMAPVNLGVAPLVGTSSVFDQQPNMMQGQPMQMMETVSGPNTFQQQVGFSGMTEQQPGLANGHHGLQQQAMMMASQQQPLMVQQLNGASPMPGNMPHMQGSVQQMASGFSSGYVQVPSGVQGMANGVQQVPNMMWNGQPGGGSGQWIKQPSVTQQQYSPDLHGDKNDSQHHPQGSLDSNGDKEADPFDDFLTLRAKK